MLVKLLFLVVMVVLVLVLMIVVGSVYASLLSARVSTQSIMRRTFTSSDTSDSTQASDSPPLQINRSLSCIATISFGAGSYECTSAPGFMRSFICALSPAISRAKS